ncbi:hypothetical protein LWI29_013857 [Acer saccharum]|uniref:F-box associated beta-propeller type 3 domain-containing protein n=1 Tax=Acer saccharum TaxID=4024 RepID=A0AA39VB08_ACESA|nr:hypothetical protein LWI29_013857 [Acer saccharum]
MEFFFNCHSLMMSELAENYKYENKVSREVKRIALLNISTRQDLTLPKFWSDFDAFSMFYDGFGYDGASDYYKLIRIVKSSESWTKVTVYSLRDNTWRMIDDDFPYLLDIFHGIGTLVMGALNWIVGGRVSVFDYGNFILSFILRSKHLANF